VCGLPLRGSRAFVVGDGGEAWERWEKGEIGESRNAFGTAYRSDERLLLCDFTEHCVVVEICEFGWQTGHALSLQLSVVISED
jgi:hypothetical protein